MENLERIIEGNSFFAGLQPHHLSVIADCASNARFSAGQVIFHEEEEADTFYLIREGKVTLNVAAGSPITVQTLGVNEVLGWSWLVPPFRWKFTANAVETTHALALDGKCLRKKCEEDHDLGYEILKRFAPVITARLQATRLQLLHVYNAYQTIVEGR